jgi:hypothetical protein
MFRQNKFYNRAASTAPYNGQQRPSYSSNAFSGRNTLDTQEPRNYSAPQYTTPAAPKPIKKKEIFDKCRDICRSVYPINKSGSKICSIAIESATFTPLINFSKPGFIGVKLENDTFFELMFNRKNISNYFAGTFTPQFNVVELNDYINLEYSQSFNRLVVNLIASQGSEAERVVSFAAETWHFLEKMLPLLEHTMKDLSTKVPECKNIFDSIVTEVHSVYSAKKQAISDDKMRALEDIIANIEYEDLHMMPSDYPTEALRIFYELKTYCVLEIVTRINEMECNFNN